MFEDFNLEDVSKEQVKGIFLLMKGEISKQLDAQKEAFTTIMDSAEASQEEKDALQDFSTNVEATAKSFDKLIDVLVARIDKED